MGSRRLLLFLLKAFPSIDRCRVILITRTLKRHFHISLITPTSNRTRKTSKTLWSKIGKCLNHRSRDAPCRDASFPLNKGEEVEGASCLDRVTHLTLDLRVEDDLDRRFVASRTRRLLFIPRD